MGRLFACGAALMSQGKASGCGALVPEKVFEPGDVFEDMEKRRLLVHSEIEEVQGIPGALSPAECGVHEGSEHFLRG